MGPPNPKWWMGRSLDFSLKLYEFWGFAGQTYGGASGVLLHPPPDDGGCVICPPFVGRYAQFPCSLLSEMSFTTA